MLKIAIINQKGGVGKTTASVNLAGALAEAGLRVLAVDVDSQGDLSSIFLDQHERLPFSIADLFDQAAGVGAADIIQPTSYPNVDVLPADCRLNQFDLTHDFISQANVTSLGDALGAVEDYQVVLLDCAPRSFLSSFSALCAADLILVPVEVELFAIRALASVEDDWQAVRRTFNPRSTLRYFLSKVPAGGKAQDKARHVLNDTLGAANVLKTAIPAMAGFRSANNRRKPVMFARSKSKPAEIMRAFAREIMEVAHGNASAA